MKEPKHIFFDLDRTLWDFDNNSKRALEQLFFKHNIDGIAKSFESFHKTYVNVNAKLWNQYGKGKITKDTLRSKRFEDTLKHYQIFDKDLAVIIGEEYIQISPYQTTLFPNAHNVLQELVHTGYKLHIITNGFKEVQYIKLNQSKLTQYFDIIVCSDELGVNKPDPHVFEHAAEKANADLKKSIMIGDDYQVDVIGAEQVGMRGVLFNPTKKYKPETHEFQIENLREFPALLPWIEKTF